MAEHTAPAPARNPVDIEGRSDRENYFLLVMVILGLISLLLQTAGLKPQKAAPPPAANEAWRPVR